MPYSKIQLSGLLIGPLLFALILLSPTPEGMTPVGLKVIALATLMALWWFTEALPIPATSLLPLALLPAMGVVSSKAAAAPYANHLIFLFLGGFLLALSMEKWNLHRRIALHTIHVIGVGPKRIILGFMVASAFLSMLISNTATAMMMVPIALAVLTQAKELIEKNPDSTVNNNVDTRAGHFKFGIALMLGIAYGCSIGGVGTIIGSPPNAIIVGVIERTFGQEISFAAWMKVGVPLSITMLFITWFLLVNVIFKLDLKELPGGKALILYEIKQLGLMKKEEKQVLFVFFIVSMGWLFRPLINQIPVFSMLHDSTIAIMGSLLLFSWPSDMKKGEFLLDWQTALRAPWGILLLFGGGLSLANAFKVSGVAQWVGVELSVLTGSSLILIIFVVILVSIFLTEFTSNTATSSIFIPIMASTAVAMSVHPYGLIMGSGLAVSFAFMLPIATPPNAVVFGSKYITIAQMAKAGLLLNFLGAVLICLYVYFALPWIWDIDLQQIPDWANLIQSTKE